jgi:hypothetical protein
MSRQSSTSQRRVIHIDDEIEVCRVERCRTVGIHAAHDVPKKLSGRPPKNCPICKTLLVIITVDNTTRRTCSCGYHRP